MTAEPGREGVNMGNHFPIMVGGIKTTAYDPGTRAVCAGCGESWPCAASAVVSVPLVVTTTAPKEPPVTADQGRGMEPMSEEPYSPTEFHALLAYEQTGFASVALPDGFDTALGRRRLVATVLAERRRAESAEKALGELSHGLGNPAIYYLEGEFGHALVALALSRLSEEKKRTEEAEGRLRELVDALDESVSPNRRRNAVERAQHFLSRRSRGEQERGGGEETPPADGGA